MYSVTIYIKGEKIDLYSNAFYSITKRVNDFTELRKRQWGFTNKYKVPKTAKNKRIFGFLSYPANTSDIAYNKIPDAALYFNGIPLINKGHALVTDSDQDYNIVLYDGAVNFYDAIKDLTLKNLDWSDLDHNYGETTMEDSFGNTEGYIYPVAKTSELQPTVQAWFDIPSPSIYIKTIINKISDISGVDIQGAIFSDTLFNESVITTKHGIKLSQESVTLEDTETLTRTVGGQSSFTETTPPNVNVAQGFYKVVLDYERYGDTQPFIEYRVDNQSIDAFPLTEDTGQIEFFSYGTDFEALMTANNPNGINTTVILTITANRINYGTVPVVFSELVDDMKLSDFMKMVMVKFGLNIYPDQKGEVVRLDYINDLDNAQVESLGKYLVEGENENYQIGSYKSVNEFNYALEDGEDDDSTGELLYNHNSGEKVTHFTSQFTQPIKLSDTRYENILFDGELEPTDGSIKIFRIRISTGTIKLFAANGNVGKDITNWAYYDFDDFKFQNLLPKYYYFISSRIFNRPIRKKFKLAIPLLEFYSIDFKKLYHIEKENSDFMINSLRINSRSGITEADMIVVNKKRVLDVDPVSIITGSLNYNEPGNQSVQLYGTESYSIGGYITGYLWEVFDGQTLITSGTKNNISFTLPQSETYNVCLTVTNEANNTNQRCEFVASTYDPAPPTPTFSEYTLLQSSACYTYQEFLITGTPSTTFSLNIKSSIINGKSNLVVWKGGGTGQLCQVTGCPVIGQIVLPKLGPAVNEISYNDEMDIDITLDSNGESYIQTRIEGVKESQSPVDNQTFISLTDNNSGYSNPSYHQRTWAKTNQCDNF